jgi:hypothetical protein
MEGAKLRRQLQELKEEEGQVNRLKALNRRMYGRAGVELLRARVPSLPLLDIK